MTGHCRLGSSDSIFLDGSEHSRSKEAHHDLARYLERLPHGWFGFAKYLQFHKRRQSSCSLKLNVKTQEVDEFTNEFLELTNRLPDGGPSQVHQAQSRTAMSGNVSRENPIVEIATGLINANKKLQSELESAISEIDTQKNQLQCFMEEARTDILTALPNRRAFNEELRRRVALLNRNGTPVALLLVDIDHFKNFNDCNGHQAGDFALQQVATEMVGCVRETDLVARVGGEEFAVILPAIKLSVAFTVADRLRNSVRNQTIEFNGARLHITVSVGLAEANFDEDPASIFKRADEGLYAAKNAGRDCGYFHDGQECRPIQQDESKPAELAEAAQDEQERVVPDPTPRMRQSLSKTQSPQGSCPTVDSSPNS